MVGKISVVINTFNEEKNIERALKSVKYIADEIIICDMYSEDKTVEIAKRLGAKIVFHKRTDYVEPVRNFAISKASNKWILVIDADEDMPKTLADRLKELAAKPIESDFVDIPRKNIIFGRWMEASMWWPDYNIRFFKKGKVVWSNQIHNKPKAAGQRLTLPAEEKWAIIHHHYVSISQFIERMNRYTSIQAKHLKESGYRFEWKDLIDKPLGEFLSRFFANEGFKDGLHGLSLSFLQAFSFLIMYLKVWEMEKFKSQEISLLDLKNITEQGSSQIDYWFKYVNLSKNPFKRLFRRFQK